jgi:hypothetical protein
MSLSFFLNRFCSEIFYIRYLGTKWELRFLYKKARKSCSSFLEQEDILLAAIRYFPNINMVFESLPILFRRKISILRKTNFVKL